MAYEYKEEIENHIICAPVHVDDEVFDELEEVYAKAKAFDEIVEVFKDYPLKTDSDVMDFIQAKLDDMEDK